MSTTSRASILGLLLASGAVGAAPFNHTFRSDLILGGEAANLVRGSEINPQNRTYRLHDKAAVLELRPSLEIDREAWLRLTLRPRLEVISGTIPEEGELTHTTRRDLWLNEGFLTFTRGEAQLFVGRQNYLWGPAEVVSPSNPFYPDILNRPNPLFLLRGITQARLSYNLGQQWNFMAMAELPALEDASFQLRFPESEPDRRRLLFKAEWSSLDGGQTLGATAGQSRLLAAQLTREPFTHFLGGYLMWTLNPAFQLYADGRVDFADGDSHPFLVGGVRYTSPGGLEWRNELIYKELGLSRTERRELEDGLNPQSAQALLLNLRLNQDNLLSERLSYSSLRQSFSGPNYFADPILGFRLLHSWDSDTGIVSGSLEGGVSDRATLVLYLAQTYGARGGDFNGLAHTLGGVFLRLTH
jgi:hypothetical protein